MKKIFLLVIILAAGMLAACGAGSATHETPARRSRRGDDHPLVGTWAWDTGDTYLYVFHADGQGTRGTPPLVQSFEWTARQFDSPEDGDGHLSLSFRRLTESWTYTIADGVLTITSNQVGGMTYSYIQLE
ncbi:MAG: hypothetical protein FWD03_04910 [Defluviitaleaceae bacterium]|nr:hypothetical protein [Defluviitaleaceae bacterium]